jgi:predicted GNAT superfamily acetyltransferase
MDPAKDLRIRLIRSNEECNACVELQRHVWGFEQPEIVPSTLLHAVGYVGGLVAGAFDAQDRLLGFVFGITGLRDGSLAHWSHMLGVHTSARNFGIGRMLKEFQRSHLAAQGVTRIFWSFDPLMAKNAYFNINRLGASVVEYVEDMYGTTASPLHLGLATDRLIVCLDSAAAVVRPSTMISDPGARILTPTPRLGDVTSGVGDREPETLLIEIPKNILEVLEWSRSTAETWRFAVRDHFHWALQRGYSVTGVRRGANDERVFYVLSRK